jgi:protein dithiol oxidoreductase (disulfide-forming)
MNRRRLLAIAALLGVSAAASGQELQAGRDYVAVVPPQPTSDPTRIVVTEFFSYACPHCYSFNPALTSWVGKLPKDVLFERVAVAFGRQPWQKPAQLFYALQSLGKAEELSPAIFRGIHVDREDFFSTDQQIIDWVAKHGIDSDQFAAAFNSFSMRSFVARGDQLGQSHHLPSVPTLVVDGKYMLPIIENGDFAAQLAVADRIIEKARAEKVH